MLLLLICAHNPYLPKQTCLELIQLNQFRTHEHIIQYANINNHQIQNKIFRQKQMSKSPRSDEQYDQLQFNSQGYRDYDRKSGNGWIIIAVIMVSIFFAYYFFDKTVETKKIIQEKHDIVTEDGGNGDKTAFQHQHQQQDDSGGQEDIVQDQDDERKQQEQLQKQQQQESSKQEQELDGTLDGQQAQEQGHKNVEQQQHKQQHKDEIEQHHHNEEEKDEQPDVKQQKQNQKHQVQQVQSQQQSWSQSKKQDTPKIQNSVQNILARQPRSEESKDGTQTEQSERKSIDKRIGEQGAGINTQNLGNEPITIKPITNITSKLPQARVNNQSSESKIYLQTQIDSLVDNVGHKGQNNQTKLSLDPIIIAKDEDKQKQQDIIMTPIQVRKQSNVTPGKTSVSSASSISAGTGVSDRQNLPQVMKKSEQVHDTNSDPNKEKDVGQVKIASDKHPSPATELEGASSRDAEMTATQKNYRVEPGTQGPKNREQVKAVHEQKSGMTQEQKEQKQERQSKVKEHYQQKSKQLTVNQAQKQPQQQSQKQQIQSTVINQQADISIQTQRSDISMQNDQASSQKLPKNSLNQTQIKATASTQYQDQTSSKVEARYKEHQQRQARESTNLRKQNIQIQPKTVHSQTANSELDAILLKLENQAKQNGSKQIPSLAVQVPALQTDPVIQTEVAPIIEKQIPASESKYKPITDVNNNTKLEIETDYRIPSSQVHSSIPNGLSQKQNEKPVIINQKNQSNINTTGNTKTIKDKDIMADTHRDASVTASQSTGLSKGINKTAQFSGQRVDNLKFNISSSKQVTKSKPIVKDTQRIDRAGTSDQNNKIIDIQHAPTTNLDYQPHANTNNKGTENKNAYNSKVGEDANNMTQSIASTEGSTNNNNSPPNKQVNIKPLPGSNTTVREERSTPKSTKIAPVIGTANPQESREVDGEADTSVNKEHDNKQVLRKQENRVKMGEIEQDSQNKLQLQGQQQKQKQKQLEEQQKGQQKQEQQEQRQKELKELKERAQKQRYQKQQEQRKNEQKKKKQQQMKNVIKIADSVIVN